MINLYTRGNPVQYCFGNTVTKKASGLWAESISEAIDNYLYVAKLAPSHSCFTLPRPILASFEQLPTIHSHPELFI